MSPRRPVSRWLIPAAVLGAGLAAPLLIDSAPPVRAQATARVYLPFGIKGYRLATALPPPAASPSATIVPGTSPTAGGPTSPPIELTPTRPAGIIAPIPPVAGWSHMTDPNAGVDLAVDPLTGEPWTVAGFGGAVRWNPDQGRATRLGPGDGLASWRLLCVAVDRQGQVWLGGADGRLSQRLADGRWQLHGPGDGAGGAGSGLRAEPVLSLSLDVGGNLWLLQESHILRRAASGAWQSVGLPAGIVAPSDLAAGPNGILWLGAKSQVYERSPDGEWTAHPLTNGLGIAEVGRRLAVAADGAVAVASFAALHLLRPGANWRTYDLSGGELAELPISVAFDVQSRLIVGTDVGVLRLALDGSWSRPLGSTEVFAADVAVDPTGRIYAVGEAGLVWSGPSPEQPGRLTMPGLRGNRVTRIALETSGAAWLLADGQGLSRRDPAGAFSQEDETTGLGSRRVWDLLLDAGGLWAATEDRGLRRRSPAGAWTGLTRADGLASDSVTAVHVDGIGQLWAGHLAGQPFPGEPTGGLSLRGLGGVWTQFTTASGLADNSVRAIGSDAQQNQWVASFDRGLTHRDALGAWTVYNAANSGLITDTLRSLAVAPDGTVYAGTPEGLAIRDPLGAWRTLGLIEGLPGERISALALEADGRLWIGTESGAAVLAPDGAITSYPAQDGGLLPGAVLAIAPAADGTVWFSSDRAGISVLNAAFRTDR